PSPGRRPQCRPGPVARGRSAGRGGGGRAVVPRPPVRQGGGGSGRGSHRAEAGSAQDRLALLREDEFDEAPRRAYVPRSREGGDRVIGDDVLVIGDRHTVDLSTRHYITDVHDSSIGLAERDL